MKNEISMNDDGVMDSIIKKVRNENSQEVFDSNLLKDVIHQLQRSNRIKERILKNVKFFFWLTIVSIFLSLMLFLRSNI